MPVTDFLNVTLLRGHLLERALHGDPASDHWQIEICGERLDAQVMPHPTGVTFVAGCGHLPSGSHRIGLYLNGHLMLADEILQDQEEEIDISLSLSVVGLPV